MSNKSSEQMMTLLQEMAAIKDVDSTERPRTQLQRQARKDRQRRRSEIRNKIKEVAAAKRKTAAD